MYAHQKLHTRRLLKALFFIGAVLFIAGAAVAGVVVFAITRDLPTQDQIVSRHVSESTKIYDRTGEVLLYEIGDNQKRTVLPFAEIPQTIKDATIAIEDERFYQNQGFDIRAIGRVFITNLRQGRIVAGASTITQQLARNAFLSPEQTITRKLKELVLAFKLNGYYSKDKILELYLNEIPYGPTIYGIEAASKAYFGKSARELTLPEAAVLAGIPKAPSYYYPWGSHRSDLIARQRSVLRKMESLNMITKEQLKEALAAPLTFQPQSQGIKAPHFALLVQDYLVQKYGEDIVRKGGLKVVTTLDWDLEQLAEKATKEGAERNEKLYDGKNTSLVAQDPKTGQILALVGSRDYFDTAHDGNFNVAVQGLRQPGSALKPFVYLSAFLKGYTPDTLVFDVPTEFAANNPNCPAIVDPEHTDTACFHPENFDEQFRGPVSLRDALAQSINIPAVKVLYLTGLEDAIHLANTLGLNTLKDPARYGLSLVLGGGEVRLVDLVHAYGVLANDGTSHPQVTILNIQDTSGRMLEQFQDSSSSVVEAQYVRLVTDILSDTTARSHLFQNSLSLTTLQGYDVALKTGTTNDYRDAWTVGYTPFLVAGVWAGNNDNTPMQRHGSSILAAVPIWNAFMKEAVKKYMPEQFPKPEVASAVKPMLNGTYLADNQIHDILYYVNRKDPLGAVPTDPSEDPQYTNWETALQEWLRNATTSAQFKPLSQTAQATDTRPFQPTSPQSPTPVSIKVESPKNGSSVGRTISLGALFSSATSLKSIRVLFNGDVVREITGTFPKDYSIAFSFSAKTFLPQNSLIIEATNEAGGNGRADVILYAQ